MKQNLIAKIVENEDAVKPTLFKPIQFEVIKKLYKKLNLTETEKRYLRGNIRNKMEAIQKLNLPEQKDDLANFLNSIGSYYITGFEALKHNGYGWYYDVKKVDVINTKVDGKLRIGKKTLNLIRVKSISKSKFISDNNLNYATNEQILKDNRIIKNKYLEKTWLQMLHRYPKMFVKHITEYKKYLSNAEDVDLDRFGV